MYNQNVDRLIEELKDLKVSEFLEIVKHFAGEVSVNYNIWVEDETPKEEEKMKFDVILKAAGGSKLAVVKIIQHMTGLGLKESKELVENAPVAVLLGVSNYEAEESKAKLSEAGAEVKIA